jgi:hypothetical protein
MYIRSKTLISRTTKIIKNVFRNAVFSIKKKPHDFYEYISPNIIRVNKLKRMRWSGHVAHVGKEKR